MRIGKVSFILALLLLCSTSPAHSQDKTKTLIILTTSDLQGQMEPMKTPAGRVGGFARLAWLIKNIKSQHPHQTLAVATGDDLMGIYFLTFKGKAIYSALSLMSIDVATLGNHEFDQGPEVLAKALAFPTFPIIETNLIPAYKGSFPALKPYVIMERSGLHIGFIGLMTPDLPFISKPQNSVKVIGNFIPLAAKWARFLKEKKGVDLVVALTHIGLELDKKLASEVPEIDVVCGSHSHILLKKPVVVTHPKGRKTIVVQTGARGKYLGMLILRVNRGRIASYQWSLLKVDPSVPQDPRVARLIARYKAHLPPAQVLTRSLVPLDSSSKKIRVRETALGDLVTDILRKYFKTDVVLLNGGGFRGDRVIPPGPVTTEDLDTLFPFGDTVVILKLKGKRLKEALERGVSGLPAPAGRFLQVSGIRMVVDPSRPPQKLAVKEGKPVGLSRPGERVRKVEILTPTGPQPLDPEKVYTVATNNYLASGGDGYFMLDKGVISKMDTYVSLKSVVQEWLSRHKTIAPKVDGRIIIQKAAPAHTSETSN